MSQLKDKIIARWTGPERPEFATGSLISYSDPPSPYGGDVCRCAQGDVLHVAGRSDIYIESILQYEVDIEVANVLGVPLFVSILLRLVNDSDDGMPEDVLLDLPKVLGKHTGKLIYLWTALEKVFNPVVEIFDQQQIRSDLRKIKITTCHPLVSVGKYGIAIDTTIELMGLLGSTLPLEFRFQERAQIIHAVSLLQKYDERAMVYSICSILEKHISQAQSIGPN